jgi:diguanylate cyclase (GGDEF)-like protein
MAWWQRKRGERTLKEAEEVISLLLREFEEGGLDWLWQMDASNRWTNVSARSAHILKMDVNSVDGKPFLETLAGEAFTSEAFVEKFSNLIDLIKHRKTISNFLIPRKSNDELRWFELSASPKFDELGNFVGYRGVGSDVTEQKNAADSISYAAKYEAITGLPNIGVLTDKANQVCEYASTHNRIAGAIAVGITNFATLKSKYGYKQSERLLSGIAKRLAISTLPEQATVGVAASDEFIIILPQVADAHELGMIQKNIDNALSKPFEINDLSVELKTAFGAVQTTSSMTGSELINQTLEALYDRTAFDHLDIFSGAAPIDGHTDFSSQTGNSAHKVSQFNSQNMALAHAPAALAGVATLLDEHERRLHNGPPEPIDEVALETLRQLHTELGNLVTAAGQNKPIDQMLGMVSILAKRVFKFSLDTGELFVAGIKPLLASVPVALGTMLLLQHVCGRELFESLGAGTAIAILGGYYGISSGIAAKKTINKNPKRED